MKRLTRENIQFLPHEKNQEIHRHLSSLYFLNNATATYKHTQSENKRLVFCLHHYYSSVSGFTVKRTSETSPPLTNIATIAQKTELIGPTGHSVFVEFNSRFLVSVASVLPFEACALFQISQLKNLRYHQYSYEVFFSDSALPFFSLPKACRDMFLTLCAFLLRGFLFIFFFPF